MSLERIGDVKAAAEGLGQFVAALQRVDPAGGPAAGPDTRGRGLPLVTRDQGTRAAIAKLGDLHDVRELTAAWDAALAEPDYSGAPVWIHAELREGNLLQRDGRLAAVIDFGLLGVGDPAVDLTAAWTFLPAERDIPVASRCAGIWGSRWLPDSRRFLRRKVRRLA